MFHECDLSTTIAREYIQMHWRFGIQTNNATVRFRLLVEMRQFVRENDDVRWRAEPNLLEFVSLPQNQLYM